MAGFHPELWQVLKHTAPEKLLSKKGENTKARELLQTLVSVQFPGETKLQQEVFEKYLSTADWLTAPKTIEEFQALKKSFIELYYGGNYFLKQILGKETLAENTKHVEGLEKLIDSTNWTLRIAAALKILLLEKIRAEKAFSANYLWNTVEGNNPKKSEEVVIHKNLEALLKAIQTYRLEGYNKTSIGRVGLVFGDFRVGDHLAHGKLLEKAKLATGILGKLVVITPNSKTIINTTKKTQVWNSKERLYRLSHNPFIDDLLMIDMPQEYWGEPTKYWQMVWENIQPELIFLGEENHPLQPTYEELSKQIGSILLIDPRPITQRSEDLLK